MHKYGLAESYSKYVIQLKVCTKYIRNLLFLVEQVKAAGHCNSVSVVNIFKNVQQQASITYLSSKSGTFRSKPFAVRNQSWIVASDERNRTWGQCISWHCDKRCKIQWYTSKILWLKIVETTTFSKATNQIPYLMYNGEEVTDSSTIIKFIAKLKNIEVDAHLSPEEKATSHALMRMLDDSFSWWALTAQIRYLIQQKNLLF